jgi:fructoselysine-6-P-deglycase FrlB-like protein
VTEAAGGPPGSAPDGPDQMGREMADGPGAVERTLAEVARLRPRIAPLVASARRIVLVGTGASLAVVRAVAPLWRQASPKRELLVRQSADVVLGDLDGERFRSSDLVVLISQSGTSPETLAAGRLARAAGSSIVVVTAHAEAPLASAASPAPSASPASPASSDGVILALGSGVEEDASTKSALASLAGLLAMADLVPSDMAGAAAVGDRLGAIVGSWATVEGVGRELATAGRVWCLGSGAGLGIAEAGALLWHEKVVHPAVAATPSEFRHGLIEAAGRADAVILVEIDEPDPRRDGYLGRLRSELGELGTLLVVIGADAPIAVAGDTPAMRALEALLRLQQLARATALAAGTYRDGFAILRRVVRPADELLA